MGDGETVRFWGNECLGDGKLIDVAEGAVPHEISLKKFLIFEMILCL